VAALVEVEALSKCYGRGAHALYALRDLSLSIEAGGVYGLLGPNGAGKSTLLRILTGLVHATAGTARLFGEALTPGAFRRLGALIESPRFYPFLTAEQTLEMLARTSGVARPDTMAILDRVGLASAADRRVDGFSLGMKQRLGVAAALIGRPELIILDEPTNGMDPAGIQEIRQLVRQLADRDGLTVMLSSHLLDEVQRTCDRVAILNHGVLAAEGRIDELLSGQARLRIEARPIELLLEKLGTAGVRDGDAALASIARADAPALLASLAGAGIELFEARWVKRDLESVFFAQTGKG
jgi:ABC-2 type transport system ATP-binding protein